MEKYYQFTNRIAKRIVTIVLILISISQLANAQGEGGDFFRNIGKIYVVVAVVVATFIGIVMYLIYLTNKVKKLEDEINA